MTMQTCVVSGSVADRQGEQRLDGWKAIVGHLGRDDRTVKRGEARGLPVHRVPGGERARVYALVGEIDRWLNPTDLAPIIESNEVPDPILVSGDTLAQPERTEARFPLKRHALDAPLSIAGCFSAVALVLAPAALHAVAPRALAAAAAASVAQFGPITPIDPQARKRELDGLHAWNLRTPASLAQARQDFGAAIAREPGYAPAYAGRANTWLLLVKYGAVSDGEA